MPASNLPPQELWQVVTFIQPHNATLQMTFYEGKQFPGSYSGDIFAFHHSSWNRSVRTGYELIRIPLHQTDKATGEYEDFMTDFVIDNHRVWGLSASPLLRMAPYWLVMTAQIPFGE
jgi:glucose/arabinose dehydrogenase